MAFPTLEYNPLQIDISYEDNALLSPVEAGYVLGRPRFTKNRRIFTLSYDLLSDTDKGLLTAHFELVGKFTNFNWTNHQTSVVYAVTFKEIIKYSRQMPGWWKFDPIMLREV